MKATSTGTSSVTSIRARPPCDRTTMGKSSSPFVASSPIRPLTPVSHRVTTPFRIAGMISAWTGWTELDAMQMSRNPISSSSFTIRFSSTSPLRRWWWVAIVIPSRRPDFSIAARSDASTLLSPGLRRTSGLVARSIVGIRENGSRYGS